MNTWRDKYLNSVVCGHALEAVKAAAVKGE